MSTPSVRLATRPRVAERATSRFMGALRTRMSDSDANLDHEMRSRFFRHGSARRGTSVQPSLRMRGLEADRAGRARRCDGCHFGTQQCTTGEASEHMTDDMLVTIVDHWQVRTDQIR